MRVQKEKTIVSTGESFGDNSLIHASGTTDQTPTTKGNPRSRTATNTNILGVQGPKAATYWFEDPEEIVREAAKLRRSRSPNKRKTHPAAPIESQQDSNVVNLSASDSSLSSVPTSLESEEGFNDAPISTESTVASPYNPEITIAQVDGIFERRAASTSPSKLASTVIPNFPPNAPSTPTSSTSPNTKKRKTQSAYTKPPRSPDRLMTNTNPPLNRDCVIALAESENKDGEKGVLRQVKGERQGVFTEDYVVVAMRFFVAGN